MRWLNVLIGILLFALLYVVFLSAHRVDGYSLGGEWTHGDESIRVPFYRIVGKPGIVTLEKRFSRREETTLVIPRVSCHALEVYLNDVLIGQFGDFERPTANIWNSVLSLSFDPSLLQDSNVLRLELFALYDFGVHQEPYLSNYSSIVGRITLLRLINSDIYIVAIGMSVILSLVLFFLSLSLPEKKCTYMNIAIAVLLAGIYLLDYQFRLATGSVEFFLWFRKIVVACGYVSTFAILQGTELYTIQRREFSKYTIWLTLAVTAGIFFQKDFYSLKRYVDLANLMLMMNPVLTVVTAFRSKTRRLLIPVVFCGITVLHAVLVLVFSLPDKFFIGYGVIVLAIGFGVILVRDFRETSLELRKTYKRAITDSLTGAFNRSVLDEISLKPRDSLVLADINHFKKINDTKGHEFGDGVLCWFVSAVRQNLRSEDILIRYGGDEFVVILFNCSIENTISIMERIRGPFNAQDDSLELSFSYGVAGGSGNLRNMLEEADRRMYRMKAFLAGEAEDGQIPHG